jgi:tetratricopeptide (TPR) repeat protein
MRVDSMKLRAGILILAIAQAAFSQSPKPENGNTAGAARSWLAANPSSPEFPDRFFAALAAEEDMGRALMLAADFYSTLKSAKDRALAARKAGGWAEASGLPLAAALWYERALTALPDAPDHALELRAAVCRLKAGDADEAFALAERAAENADGASAARARILSVWALAALGRREEALGRGRILASQALPAEAAPSAAYALAYLSGDSAKVLTAGGDHPDALLLAALRGDGSSARNGVKALDEPVLYLSGILGEGAFPERPQANENPSPPPEPRASPISAAASGSAIMSSLPLKIAGYHQAGAFAAKENAEALEKRIDGAGFSAETRVRRSASGKTRYFVIVPYGEDGEPGYEALRKAGFETIPYPYRD